jgi:hypothetical protein
MLMKWNNDISKEGRWTEGRREGVEGKENTN